MRLIFASVVSARHFSEMHSDMEVNDRLLSFAELLYAPPDFLEHYVKTGRHPPKVKGRRFRDETWDSQVPRPLFKKPGKARPEPKPISHPAMAHWNSSTFIKRKALYFIAKVKAYEAEGVEGGWE